MNDFMLMLAAARQGDLTRQAGQDKMAARARAAARPARDDRNQGRPRRRQLRLVPAPGLTVPGTRPLQGR